MRLDTFDEAKAALSALMNDYDAERISAVKFRNLVHSFSVMLAWYKHADDLRIEERIDAIEKAIAERGGPRAVYG